MMTTFRGYIDWAPGELRRTVNGEVWVRRCEWFAQCYRSATHLEPHPVLGEVPACDRCPNVGRNT